jgi:hypothetical protein
VSPANTKPVRPFAPERHLDLQADLHFFFDTLVTGKRVLDVGAGLGKSKARIRHNRVITYEPSPACRGLVDLAEWPTAPYDVVTAFEVLEHVQDDAGFLRQLESLATQAIFLTTPNWHVAQCQSADHYREYTPDEFGGLIETVFPNRPVWLWAYYKDAEGGWVDEPATWRTHRGLKHVALISSGMGLSNGEMIRLDGLVRVRAG